MPLGRERNDLTPRHAGRLMHQLQHQAATREKMAEDAIKSQFNMKNMSNVHNIVKTYITDNIRIDD